MRFLQGFFRVVRVFRRQNAFLPSKTLGSKGIIVLYPKVLLQRRIKRPVALIEPFAGLPIFGVGRRFLPQLNRSFTGSVS